jgi:hypothetical protein
MPALQRAITAMNPYIRHLWSGLRCCRMRQGGEPQTCGIYGYVTLDNAPRVTLKEAPARTGRKPAPGVGPFTRLGFPSRTAADCFRMRLGLALRVQLGAELADVGQCKRGHKTTARGSV